MVGQACPEGRGLSLSGLRERSWISRRRRRGELTPPFSHRQSIIVRDGNIWTSRGFAKGSILIENGKISRIARRIQDPSVKSIDASGLCVLPGLVDVHVHLRDMKLSYKEDFATGTAAAAAGGFTTVLDMPNTEPPTDSPQRLAGKQEIAKKKVHVNVGFHAAATSDNTIIHALAKIGAFSLKLYMPKPIKQFDIADDEQVDKMMDSAHGVNIPVTIHAEDPSVLTEGDHPGNFEELAKSRSPVYETLAVNRIMRIQERSKCKVHYCHLTLPSSLETIESAKTRATSEVTPHHLLLSRRRLAKLGWRGWMVPPLRSEEIRRGLLAATLSSHATVVASDHAPHRLREKDRLPHDSLPGIPGLETTLPLMLTLVNKRLLSMRLLVKLLAGNPSRIFRLRTKATLRRGFDGDLVLVDLKKKSKVDSSKFYSKAKFSPFDETITQGAVDTTIVAGSIVYQHEEIVAPEGCGSVLQSDYLS